MHSHDSWPSVRTGRHSMWDKTLWREGGMREAESRKRQGDAWVGRKGEPGEGKGGRGTGEARIQSVCGVLGLCDVLEDVFGVEKARVDGCRRLVALAHHENLGRDVTRRGRLGGMHLRGEERQRINGVNTGCTGIDSEIGNSRPEKNYPSALVTIAYNRPRSHHFRELLFRPGTPRCSALQCRTITENAYFAHHTRRRPSPALECRAHRGKHLVPSSPSPLL